MKIELNSFGGIAPRFAPKMLPDNAATTAQNLEVLNGKIVPLSDLTLPVDNEGIYKVKGPIVDDEHDRYYQTDGSSALAVTYGSVKFPIPTAPVGSATAAFTDIVTSSVKGYTRPCSTVEEEMAFIEVVDGDDDNSKKIRFSYPGAVSDTSFGLVFTDKYHQLHMTDEKFLPDAYSTSPADGTSLEILSDNNEVIGKYYIESSNVYESITPANPTGKDYVLYGYKVEFVIRFKYIDTIKDNYYLYRYLDALGQEGPPSDLSAIITRYPGETVTLSNIPASATGMTKVRIYRSAGVEQAAGYYFLADVTLGDGTYEDTTRDADLAEVMPSYGNPPDAMDNLTLMSGGILAANTGKDIYFTEPYLPNTWPSTYALNVDDTIVAMASRRNALIVMTDVKLHMFSGNDPSSILPVELAYNQPCLAQQGVVKIDDTVFYPSDDGLVSVSNAGFGLVTKKSFRKDDWADLKPSTFIGTEYDNKYLVTNEDDLNIIIDIAEGIVTTYTDGLEAVWQSKVFVTKKAVAFSYIKVVAASYPVTIDLMTADASVLSISIPSGEPLRLPVLRKEVEWQFKITTEYRVDSIILATSGAEI